MEPQTANLISHFEDRIRTAIILTKVKKPKRPLVVAQRGRSAAILEEIGEHEKNVERLKVPEAILKSLTYPAQNEKKGGKSA